MRIAGSRVGGWIASEGKGAVAGERVLTGGATPATADVRAAGQATSGVLPAWGEAVRFAVLAVLGVRLLLTAWAALDLLIEPIPAGTLQQQYGQWGVPLYTEGWPGLLLGPWQREDSIQFQRLAANGYAPNTGDITFSPLLPLLIRLVGFFTLGNYAVAGTLISEVAITAAVAILYRLVQLDFSRLAAQRTVAYLLLFPTAYYFHIPYTEPLLLCLVVLACYLARQGHWSWVVPVAYLAALTRIQGVLIAIPIAIEGLAAAGWRLRALRRPAFPLAVIAAPLGLLTYFGFNTWIVGEPRSWVAWQAASGGKHPSLPWDTVLASVRQVLGERGITINTFDLGTLLLFVVLFGLVVRYLRLSYVLWTAAMILLPLLSSGNPAQPPGAPLMGITRYLLPIFPAYLALAVWALRRPRWVHLAIIVLWVSWLLIWVRTFIHGHWVA